MSRAYYVLGLTVLGTFGTIFYVHYDQEREIKRMRKSVFADAIREQARRQALGQTERADVNEESTSSLSNSSPSAS